MWQSQHVGFFSCGLVAGRTWDELKTKKPEVVSKAQRTQMGGDPGSEWLPHSQYIGWEEGPGPVMDVMTVARGGDLVSAPTKYLRKTWSNPTPVQCFEELHSNQIYVQILHATNNRMAELNLPSGQRIDKHALKVFLGIAIFMSIVKLPSKRDYWYGQWKHNWLVEAMSYQRWTFIKLHLRFAVRNEAKLDKTSSEYDKAYPIREVAEMAGAEWFAARSQPERLSIDEQMYGTKGYCVLKTYMPNKPTKRGAKCWAAADPLTGYVYVMEIYTGKTNKDDKGEQELARSVVLRLSACFRPYTKFYADNYFVDLGTVQKMWAVNRMYLTGTVQSNRKGWPRHLQPLVDNAEKGSSATCHLILAEASEKAKILAVVWHDTKVVRYVSSEAQGVGVTMARRSYVEGQSRDRPAVDVTKLYQDNMGGVDRADSQRSAYGLSFKIKNKWPVMLYLKMIVETSINNAYINWLTYQTYPATNKPTGREFREKLARQLCGVQLDVPAPIAGHFPIRCRVDNAPCARNCKVCCGTQWVTHLGARKQIRTGRRTVYKCSKCDVFLCIGDHRAYGEDPKTKDDFQPNCFEAFHTDPQFASLVFQ